MILLYDTAIRIAELLELKISSLKLTSVPSIHIHGKGDKERSVSITDATVSHLKKYLRQFHPEMLPDQPLFYTKIKGSSTQRSLAFLFFQLKSWDFISDHHLCLV